jgi:hypothetical protein
VRVKKTRDGLTECDADPALLVPYQAAWQVQSIAWHIQDKSLRNSGRGSDFQRGSGRREVADQAINGPAAEPDGSAFQHAMTRRSAMFGHGVTICRNPKKSIKRHEETYSLWLYHLSTDMAGATLNMSNRQPGLRRTASNSWCS